MIKINLLPFKGKKASTFAKDVRGLVYLLIIVCIAFGWYYYRLLDGIQEQKANIVAIKTEINKMQPIAQEYQAIQEAKKQIERRIQTVDKLKTGRALAARSLFDISTIIKDGVWIKSLKKSDNKFEIEGRSFVHESISEFIEMLSKLAYVSNVELKNVQDVNEEGIVIKKFILTGNISI